jgi:hypothetical protein
MTTINEKEKNREILRKNRPHKKGSTTKVGEKTRN